MSEFLATNPLAISVAEARRSAFPNSRPRYELKPNFLGPFSAELSNARNLGLANDDRSVSVALSSRANGSYGMRGPSRGYGFYNELEFEDKEEANFGLERNSVEEDSRNLQMNSETRSVPFDGLGLRDDATTATGLEDSVELNSELNGDKGSRKGFRDEDLVRIEGDADSVDLKKDDKFSGKIGFRRVKQVIRRSNLLAKQVISIRSALSLGFVSQLWVDTTSWMVLFVEVRPNLLSGDSEKFLLEDISQVGDVVLVQNESVIENEFKMVGLETLVGYKVVTPSQRNIGKVRGYTFSISSGAVEELELDSFGLSIIPSSLVSTYSLLVEDVLEVVSDAVVVHEAAASRIQRLSKGFLGNQNVGTSLDDVEEYSDPVESVTSGHVSRRRSSYGRKKPNRRNWDTEDDWELPMDYL